MVRTRVRQPFDIITGQYGGEFVQEISPWCGVVWYGMIGNWILGIGFKLSKTY